MLGDVSCPFPESLTCWTLFCLLDFYPVFTFTFRIPTLCIQPAPGHAWRWWPRNFFSGLAQQWSVHSQSCAGLSSPDPGPSLIPSIDDDFSISNMHQNHLESLLEKILGPNPQNVASRCEVGPENLHAGKVPGAAAAAGWGTTWRIKCCHSFPAKASHLRLDCARSRSLR